MLLIGPRNLLFLLAPLVGAPAVAGCALRPLLALSSGRCDCPVYPACPEATKGLPCLPRVCRGEATKGLPCSP